MTRTRLNLAPVRRPNGLMAASFHLALGLLNLAGGLCGVAWDTVPEQWRYEVAFKGPGTVIAIPSPATDAACGAYGAAGWPSHKPEPYRQCGDAACSAKSAAII